MHALTQAGIPISTINQGAGKLNLLIGIPEDKYEKAIQAIYETIGESGQGRESSGRNPADPPC